MLKAMSSITISMSTVPVVQSSKLFEAFYYGDGLQFITSVYT